MPTSLVLTTSRRARAGTTVLAAVLLAGTALAANTNFTAKAELSFKEAYDSNVYIQDTLPLPAHVAAAQANGLTPVQPQQGSFVSAVVPRFSVDCRPCTGFNLAAAYAPEIVYYHAEPSEDYVAHRGTLNLTGKVGPGSYELLNTATYIGGSKEGPTFGRPGDIPAIGGIPLRDRRTAFVFRNGFKFTEPVGRFFIRPVAQAYVHDFLTDQRITPPADRTLYVYENYLDRQDVNGGVDLGAELQKGFFAVLGYRYGKQDQFIGPDCVKATNFVDSPYDSTYHRVLAGFEGSPWPWLKLAVMGGPDLRQWADGTPAGFDRDELLYYIDATVTLLPTKQDTIVLLNRRYEQPAFSSQSVYEDITYNLTWKHKIGDHLTVGAGFQLYIGDWQAPVDREDWIYTPSASLSYTFNQHLAAELTYAYDWVENQSAVVAGTQTAYADGREFTRHLVALGCKYSF